VERHVRSHGYLFEPRGIGHRFHQSTRRACCPSGHFLLQAAKCSMAGAPRSLAILSAGRIAVQEISYVG